MNLFLLAALIVNAVSCQFALWRQFQMLQQNSYFPSRYAGWLRGSDSVAVAGEAILFCLSSLLYANGRWFFQLLLALLLLGWRIPVCLRTHRTSIKKLVLTARVKRLYGSAILIPALLILFSALFPHTMGGEICGMLAFMLTFVTPLLALLCWLVMSPAEKAVAAWYVRDAKRILRAHSGLIVVGVTGSYGKTTTKFILNRILSEKYNVVATPQSYNTPMGVVRTVRNDLKPQTQVFLCEMGAKKPGDVREICEIAQPRYGIITSVGEQHLDTFHTVDNVFRTKFELADAVRANGGQVFVNGSSAGIAARLQGNEKGCRVYGMDSRFEFYAENITYGRNGSSFDLVLAGERIPVTTKLLGLHSVSDIVAAASLAFVLGVPASGIRFAVASLTAPEHRLELKSFRGHSLLIDDAYNANPEGSLEAVRVLGSFEGMRKVIITPGLIELGGREYDANYALGLEAAKYCDIIILVGKNRSKPLREAVESTDFDPAHLYIVSSFAEAMGIYAPTADENSIVLLENDLPDNYLN